MGQLSSRLRVGGYFRTFWCPGCEEPHTIRIGPIGAPCWTFNDNEEAPTFEPSIHVTSGHFMHGSSGSCWCTYNAEKIANGEKPSDFTCVNCHSFVTDGNIKFLDDCTHALAGQTVPIPELPEHLRDDPA